VDGHPIDAVDAVQHRRRIGYVFQGIGLFPHMSVAQNVGVVPRLLGWSEADIQARTTELLELVGLDPGEYGPRGPHQLSGGQQQRVGLARALAARPPIVLMDEPFGALDPITRDELQEEYLRLHRVLELTTVLVTHDVTEALLMADRIAVMRAGRLRAVASPRELLADPGDDYARRLMAMPRRQAARLDALMDGS
jgi:osmoprotectant transport system ATP-binding protein